LDIILDGILQNINFTPFLVSIKLAVYTTLILFFISLPIAWWISQTKSKFKIIVETITALPLVLPPTVIGFYILLLFSPNFAFGGFLKDVFDINLVFSFYGLVVASCIYSLPFMLQPLQSGFENLNKNMIDASYVCKKSQITTIFKVALPNIKSSLVAAFVITFFHTIGEFGVVLMIGGSIPGETKVASIAIYEFVEVMDFQMANIYSLIMISVSFIVLFFVYMFNRNLKFKIIR
jgi:molybdate transport system permease protein